MIAPDTFKSRSLIGAVREVKQRESLSKMSIYSRCTDSPPGVPTPGATHRVEASRLTDHFTMKSSEHW